MSRIYREGLSEAWLDPARGASLPYSEKDTYLRSRRRIVPGYYAKNTTERQ